MSSRRRLRRLRGALSQRLLAGARALPRRLAFAMAPLLLLLILAEVAARAVWSPPASTGSGLTMIPHPTRIWSLPPGEITADGVSHRIGPDGLRAVPETGAAHRVLTLGDSSIFGHGLEDGDTLHARLSAALEAEGVDADVFCGGVPGYSSAQSLILLDEVGWDLDPDLIVIGNLWSDNSREYFVDAEWLAELRSPSRRMDRALAWSRAWSWFRGSAAPQVTEDGRLPVGWVREPYPTRDGPRRVALSDYAANLDRMLRQAAGRGVGAIFLAPANRHRLEPDRSFAMWDVYFEAMRTVADRRGVPVVDALEPLKQAGYSAGQAFLDEMHPTAAGNAAYAGALTRALLVAGWPDAPLIPDAEPPAFDAVLKDDFEALGPMVLPPDVRPDTPPGGAGGQ